MSRHYPLVYGCYALLAKALNNNLRQQAGPRHRRITPVGQVHPIWMQNIGLSRHVRTVLERAPDSVSVADLLLLVDDFVNEHPPSPNLADQLVELEEELTLIHHDVVDHSTFEQSEIFLSVLFHLGPILPPTSIISWFDIILRPALREPRLPTPSVNNAKELILSALRNNDEKYSERLVSFRRRLFDLYLLDAFNEGSGDDALEWAELDEDQREKRTRWKANLEDLLLRYGNERPQVRLVKNISPQN